MPPQPSQESFENALAFQWSVLDPSRPVWLEDESPQIGTVNIPIPIANKMTSPATPVVFLDRPVEERLSHLHTEYGSASTSELIAATMRLEKRFGGERTRGIVKLIEQGAIAEAIKESLHYYDKTYTFSKNRHSGQYTKSLQAVGNDSAKWAILLQQIRESLFTNEAYLQLNKLLTD